MKLDAQVFGGELERLIANHARLEADAAAADAAFADAQTALKAAREQDRQDAVAARIAGKGGAAATHEQKAEAALKAAKFSAEVAQMAMLAAQDQLVDETTRSEYDATLGEREDSITQAALNAVSTLEELLGEVSIARAYRRWLREPVRVDRVQEPTPSPVPVTAEGFRKPNGEPGDAGDLVRALASALRRDAEPPPAAAYGLPVGMHLVNPWGGQVPHVGETTTMSPAAARIFQELAEPAKEEEVA